MFDKLANQVAAAVEVSCDWEIPASPQGGSFDRAKTNVQLTLDRAVEQLRKVPDVSACGSREGWHYDNALATMARARVRARAKHEAVPRAILLVSAVRREVQRVAARLDEFRR